MKKQLSTTNYLKPRLSEKSYGLVSASTYVVVVERKLNKITIKQEIESQYDVKVASVRTLNITGKSKRTISKKGRRLARGSTNSYKKAYIVLKDNQSLPFFEQIEEDQKKEEKITKEFVKQQEKENKPKRKLNILKSKDKSDNKTFVKSKKV